MDTKNETMTTEGPSVTAAANGNNWDKETNRPLEEQQVSLSASSPPHPLATLHGLSLWLVIAGLYLGIYLVALELTMLSTVIPTLTNEFGTIADISWYETAYVLALCVCIPIVGKTYDELPIKLVYLGSLAIFEVGLIVCAWATTSSMFIGGRVINGIGSAGLISGALLIIGSACQPDIRPLVTAAAMSMISIGSMTGPIIAGVLTSHLSWRWCFWLLLPLGALTMLITATIKLPEISAKAPLRQALHTLPRKLDPLGFVLFAMATIMILLAITWGGGQKAWSSQIIIGLLCGGVVALTLFIWSARVQGDRSLIPPSCLTRRTVWVGSLLMFLQGGCTQLIPFALPLWFQAILGNDASTSAVHFLPSLISSVLALITFGALVRKLHYITPWAVFGSLLTAIGSGFLSTLTPEATSGQWIGYQILTHIGRGVAFQVPVIAVQEDVALASSATSLATINLFMQLGIAISVSVSQTVFRNQLQILLRKYAPAIDPNIVVDAGATAVRKLIPAADTPGFLKAYNLAITNMFHFSTAASALAFFVSFALPWQDIATKTGED